jgi:RHS repeat-associated protein
MSREDLTNKKLANNRLGPGVAASPVWDAAGNLINDGQGLALAYDAKNRLVQASDPATGMLAQYAYNAAGDRVEKTVTGSQATQERYVYGLSGELLGVYDVNGNPIEETAYLDDGRPVALARPVSGSPGAWTTYPILTDQLGTPREILDPNAGTPVWEWEAKEPFGNELPNQTISGQTFVYRGRFPGQVYDLETGWIHNGFRDYDAVLGRYAQSDPLGLNAGWNDYSYSMDNAINWYDFEGLEVDECREPAFNGNMGPVDHYWLKTDTIEAGMGTEDALDNSGNQYDFLGSPVYTVPHRNRSKDKGAECRKVNGANEATVNALIKPGRRIGRFLPPVNYCHSFVDDVLKKSGGVDPFNDYIPLPIPNRYISK